MNPGNILKMSLFRILQEKLFSNAQSPPSYIQTQIYINSIETIQILLFLVFQSYRNLTLVTVLTYPCVWIVYNTVVKRHLHNFSRGTFEIS